MLLLLRGTPIAPITTGKPVFNVPTASAEDMTRQQRMNALRAVRLRRPQVKVGLLRLKSLVGGTYDWLTQPEMPIGSRLQQVRPGPNTAPPSPLLRVMPHLRQRSYFGKKRTTP